MPRYHIPSSPWTTTTTDRGGSSRSSSSGRWMSRGRAGGVIHRLTRHNNGVLFVMETRMISGSTGSEPNDHYHHHDDDITTVSHPHLGRTIRTELPVDLQESLSLASDHHGSVMELMVLHESESESERRENHHEHENDDNHNSNDNHHQERESVLLLYTSHSVYVVTIAFTLHHFYDQDDSHNNDKGRIVSVQEPLDRQLPDDSSTIICRIRRAPRPEDTTSSSMVVVAPPGSFAVLVQQTETNDYQLWLCQLDLPNQHHQYQYYATVTIPLQFQIMEPRLTDFCFAATASSSSGSSGATLWTGLSILLLNGAGDVYSASPILFDQSIVTRTVLDDSLGVLQERLEALSQKDDDDDEHGAEWRRIKAAHQYLLDVFISDGHFHRRRQFCTAQLRQAPDRSAARWPTKLQGPLILSQNRDNDDDDSPRAVAIEPFGPSSSSSSTGSSEWMVGVAIAKTLGKVDFACLSPTTLLPRFAFESRNDALELDDAIFGLAALVERVDLCPTDAAEPSIVPSSSMIHLVRDPIVHHLLHYATSSAVYTISTNVMRVIQHQLLGLPPVDPIRTTAWVNLHTVGDEPIQGMVVAAADAGAGHCLYVGLPHDITTINVAEASYLHEFDALFHRPVTATDATDSPPLLLLENNDNPLFSDLQPLLETIQAGLSNMGRFVGSETSHRDIAPDLLAVVLQTKKRCDEEIVVPLLELKKILEQHRAKITASLAEQERQLREARDTIQQIQARMTPIGERLETAKANAMALSERSVAVLQTSQKLLPTITHAEYEFFQMIQRMNIKCTQLESQVRKLNDLVVARCDTFDAAAIAESLSRMDQDRNMEQINALLSFENQQLQAIQTRLTDTDRLTRNVMKGVGMNQSTRYPALFNIEER